MTEAAAIGELRRSVPTITAARLTSNAGIRLWGPLLPQVASGLGVSTATAGLALSAGEFSGVLAPLIGARTDRAGKGPMMTVALVLMAVGSVAAAASGSVLLLGLALVAVFCAKTTYDTAMGAWIADRVPYERRGRVVGITETSWAGSLLVVIPVLLLLAAATSWSIAVVCVAAANVVAAVAVRAVVRDGPRRAVAVHEGARVPIRSVLGAWPLFASLALLMTASQCLFVVFSSWLADDHGASAAGVSAVSFLLGGIELVASLGTIVVTDRLGKHTAALLGTALMVPAAAALAIGNGQLAVGIVALVVFTGGFEFALVSTLPMVTEVRPEARGTCLGVAVGLGTLGRGAATIGSTAAYDRIGVSASAVGALACAVGVLALGGAGRRRHGLR